MLSKKHALHCWLQGNDGVVVVKTNQAILVGTYKDPTQPGEATVIVEGVADYLKGVGYVSNNSDCLNILMLNALY